MINTRRLILSVALGALGSVAGIALAGGPDEARAQCEARDQRCQPVKCRWSKMDGCVCVEQAQR